MVDFDVTNPNLDGDFVALLQARKVQLHKYQSAENTLKYVKADCKAEFVTMVTKGWK